MKKFQKPLIDSINAIYGENTDAKLKKCGFNDRELVEHEGPERAARDMINLIKKAAVEKLKSLPKDTNEVDITVAMIGDSRTGKSEMSEKMEEVLSMKGPSPAENLN